MNKEKLRILGEGRAIKFKGDYYFRIRGFRDLAKLFYLLSFRRELLFR